MANLRAWPGAWGKMCGPTSWWEVGPLFFGPLVCALGRSTSLETPDFVWLAVTRSLSSENGRRLSKVTKSLEKHKRTPYLSPYRLYPHHRLEEKKNGERHARSMDA